MSANESDPLECFKDPVSFFVFSSFTAANVLLLPLSLYVLGLGFSRRKLRRAASHLDHFTFHSAAMDLLPVCGSVMFCAGAFSDNEKLMWESVTFFSPNWSAKLHFNTLTCVERYLAVVHPITYLGLKKSGGVVIRNVSAVHLWLVALVWPVFHAVSDKLHTAAFLFSLSVAFVIISFCNLAVLCVLIRPGPGERRGSQVRVDPSRKRAFQIVSSVFAVLFVAALGVLVCQILSLFVTLSACVVLNVVAWFTFPCGLVLPLLYLHRTRK